MQQSDKILDFLKLNQLPEDKNTEVVNYRLALAMVVAAYLYKD